MNEEAALLAAARRGQGEAFDLLLEPYMQRAYRTAYLITHDPHAAADALQEALIRAHKSLRNVRDGASFYPWFSRIVVNEAVKQATRHAAAQSVPLPDMPAGEGAPEGAVLAAEEREQLWRSVQSLSPAHRAVVVLRYYEDLSEAEIAAALGVSPGTVKSRLHYARAALGREIAAANRLSAFLGRLTRLAQGGLKHG